MALPSLANLSMGQKALGIGIVAITGLALTGQGKNLKSKKKKLPSGGKADYMKSLGGGGGGGGGGAKKSTSASTTTATSALTDEVDKETSDIEINLDPSSTPLEEDSSTIPSLYNIGETPLDPALANALADVDIPSQINAGGWESALIEDSSTPVLENPSYNQSNYDFVGDVATDINTGSIDYSDGFNILSNDFGQSYLDIHDLMNEFTPEEPSYGSIGDVVSDYIGGNIEYNDAYNTLMNDFSYSGNDATEELEGATTNQETQISGCTDPASHSYNPDATVDDGSCMYYRGRAEENVYEATDNWLQNYVSVETIELEETDTPPLDPALANAFRSKGKNSLPQTFNLYQ